MRYYLPPVRMATIKKTTKNTCWWGCREKRTLVHGWWECKLVQSLWKTVWKCLKKLKRELRFEPTIPFLGVYISKKKKKRKTLIWKDNMHANVHSSITYSCHNVEEAFAKIVYFRGSHYVQKMEMWDHMLISLSVVILSLWIWTVLPTNKFQFVHTSNKVSLGTQLTQSVLYSHRFVIFFTQIIHKNEQMQK